MANVCENKITIIGLKEPTDVSVKALSKAMFGIDLDSMNPKHWGEDDSVDGKTWYVSLVSEYQQQRHARYCVLYPYKPYEMLGVAAPRFYVETKWAPPVKEIKEASKSFPELTFHLDWWIEQDGPSGELVIRNGDDIDELFRPSSWYLFDDAVFYPTVSLLPAHLPYTLAQRGALRIFDAIHTIEGLDRLLSDRRFIDSPYSNERDPAALAQTKNTLKELLEHMRSSAERLTFEGVFLGIKPYWNRDKSSPAEVAEKSILNIDEL